MRIAPGAVKVVHFTGIGGIGMSGIAEVLFNLGYKVQGSDISENANVKRLKTLGIPVAIGHQAENVEGAQLIVISGAVKNDNPELQAARTAKIPVLHRADMLAELMRLKFSVAVAGTHGKTTTTSLMAALLDMAGLDPTVINGGIINAYNANARLGTGEWMAVEADESDGSFVKLPATFAVVTNIDPEHMEHYGTEEALIKAFHTFISNLPFYGLGIMCKDHPTVAKLAREITDRRIVTYGFKDDADIRGHNIRLDKNGSFFDVDIIDRAPDYAVALSRTANGIPFPKRLKDLFIPMVGVHNVQNALAVVAVAQELNLKEETLRQALAQFAGVKRRFTVTGQAHGITIVDDYAHHPVEIRAVIQAARQYINRNTANPALKKAATAPGRVIAVVQPHRYSRLRDLFHDFAVSFDGADHIIIAPVYAAGEDPLPGIDSVHLAKEVQKHTDVPVWLMPEPAQLAELVHSCARSGDVVLCMGAGTVTQWANALPDELMRMPQVQESAG